MKNYRKLIVSLITFLVSTATVAMEGHLIPEQYVPYAVGLITLAGSYGVYRAHNDDSDPLDEPRHSL